MATTIPTLPDVPNRVTGRATYSADSDAFNAALPAWATAANTLGGEIEAWYDQVNTWQSTVGTNYTQIQTWHSEAQTAATSAGDDRALSEAAKLLSQAAATISTEEAANAASTAAIITAAWASVTALNDNAHLHTIAAVQGLQDALDGLRTDVDAKADNQATIDNLNLRLLVTTYDTNRTADKRFLIKSGNYTLSAGERVAFDVTSGALIATLPSGPTAGDACTISVIEGDVETNTLTVSGNGGTINGDTELVYDEALLQLTLTFIYSGTEWRIA